MRTEEFRTSDVPALAEHTEAVKKMLLEYPSENSWTDYLSVIRELSDGTRYRVLPGREFFKARHDPACVTVYFRHDIDNDPFTAVRMAKEEKKLGLHGSYYVLHSAEYYGKTGPHGVTRYTCMDPLYREIESLGHEVGVHQDLMTLMLYHGVDPLPFEKKELEYYKKIGMTVRGVVSHGGIINSLGLNNTFIFSEFNRRGTYDFRGKTYRYGELSLADFGFDYEGYLPKCNARLSDISSYPGRELPERLRACRPGDLVSLLLHPIHWKDDVRTQKKDAAGNASR